MTVPGRKNLTLNGVAYKVLKILAENGDQLSNSFHIKLDKDGNYAFDVEEGFTLSRFKADIYGHALIDDLTEDEAAATAEDMVALSQWVKVRDFLSYFMETMLIQMKN